MITTPRNQYLARWFYSVTASSAFAHPAAHQLPSLLSRFCVRDCARPDFTRVIWEASGNCMHFRNRLRWRTPVCGESVISSGGARTYSATELRDQGHVHAAFLFEETAPTSTCLHGALMSRTVTRANPLRLKESFKSSYEGHNAALEIHVLERRTPLNEQKQAYLGSRNCGEGTCGVGYPLLSSSQCCTCRQMTDNCHK